MFCLAKSNIFRNFARMKISLIISTYNFPVALNLCLESVTRLIVKPDEIIVADDGSEAATAEVIARWKKLLPMPLKHVWQEDKGFRLAEIRNKALAIATGDYIIQIDGDIIMERHFIKDHIRYAKKGQFVCGSRSRITEAYTNKLKAGKKLKFSFFRPGLYDRMNALRFRRLTPFFYKYDHLRGCNMAFWREDILAINGYDENIKSYGYEDEDVQERLMRIGKKKKFVKFMCIEYHVWHPEHPTRKNLAETRKLIDHNNEIYLIRSEKGIEQHKDENNIIE
jgi:glycosyltransferase involved in cell wall biosynthesis